MILIHRCNHCNHPHYYHATAPDCSYGGCICPEPDQAPVEPELAPSFRLDGSLIEELHDPAWLKACRCERCAAVRDENGLVA